MSQTTCSPPKLSFIILIIHCSYFCFINNKILFGNYIHHGASTISSANTRVKAKRLKAKPCNMPTSSIAHNSTIIASETFLLLVNTQLVPTMQHSLSTGTESRSQNNQTVASYAPVIELPNQRLKLPLKPVHLRNIEGYIELTPMG